jgi:glycolate oxidase FAD binding subunit
MSRVCPSTLQDARDVLAGATEAGQAVRIVGAGTKGGWGRPGADPELVLQTAGLDGVLEHNAGDLTAVLEPGVPLSRAQETFASRGQMFALDPWPGPQEQATIGGVLATGDSGPLRHRYGAARDLVLGMTVVLSDGTVARSGGQVIKNVAGYDLAKLFCGSFGTLGLIASVNIRLHPRPAATATAHGRSDDPAALARAALALAGAPLELEALDFIYQDGQGAVLAQLGGVQAEVRAQRVARLMSELELGPTEVVHDDEELWAIQRAGQRAQAPDRVLVHVAARPGGLAELLEVVRSCAARAVGRVALGLSYVEVELEALEGLLGALPAQATWTLLDAPASVRSQVDPWGEDLPEPTLELMRRVKARFDPAGTCNPGVFVGGL